MLLKGKTELGRGPLMQADALQLPYADASFDIVTVAFGVRNFERLSDGLQEIRRVLKPGGTLLVLEFGQPRGALFGALFRFYSRWCMPVIGGIVTGNRAAYEYLPATSSQFPCREAFVEILSRAGFSAPSWKGLTFGIAYIYQCTRG
jgi:demethylmenaquinone methyltransferase/2-methoxy-6-polyprenyl-1,4-benzoquinol methylase